MQNREEVLFNKLNKKKITFQHVAEVGVYLPHTSNIGAFTKSGIKSTFVEPDPHCVKEIEKYYKNFNNITIHPVAIFDTSGTVELVQRKASTFLKMLSSSPAIINDGYSLNDDDTFIVDAKTFDEIDDGSIDLLSIDIEGGEWFVIKHMVSRPLVLSIETHGAMYTNPYISEIKMWMIKNNYIIWYMDGSDTVFIKSGLFKLNVFDKIKLFIINVFLNYKKYRKISTRKIKKIFKF